jgi:uncharacterized low-complexity protein
MAKHQSKTLAAAVGAAFIASAALSPVAVAGENPFQINELNSGYQVADAHEGKCGDKKADGEGSCGGDKSDGEGSCGGDKSDGEGSCGGDKSDGEGSCGGEKSGSEGSCGEKS